MKTWKVLPTNPDFQNLTDEQKTWLWEDYLLDNPEVAKKIAEQQDEDFNKEWDKLDEGVDETTPEVEEEFEEVTNNFEEYVKSNNLEVQYSEATQAILSKIKEQDDQNPTPNPLDGDWEEIEGFDDFEDDIIPKEEVDD